MAVLLFTSQHETSDVPFLASPNFGYPRGTQGRNGHTVQAIVIHVAEGALTDVDRYFENPSPGGNSSLAVSAHFCVGYGGELHQYVKVEDACWGAGELDAGYRLPSHAPRGVNPNLWTISIEHEGYSGHPFTWFQIKRSMDLLNILCHRFLLTPSPDNIIPHSQLAPVNRAGCPGPTYPLTAVINVLRSVRGLPPV
jgi:N-acetylmuramoyl-L-alanine amidase